MIVTVDEDIYQLWRTNCTRVIKEELYYDSDSQCTLARQALGLSIRETNEVLSFEKSSFGKPLLGDRGWPVEYPNTPLDIFLFPKNWKDRLDELQHALPHSDPEFMKKLALDAKLCPISKT